MSEPEPYIPIVTRLPEALQEEAEAIAEAEAALEKARVEAEANESDAMRLQRESE